MHVCMCAQRLTVPQEAKEIDDRASAAARERKLTATPASSSTAALQSLKKQGDKEFAQVEAVWRSKFKITKEGEVLLACTRFFVCVCVC